MERVRAALAEWRRVASALRRSRRLQLVLEVVVGRFRHRCWTALVEQRRLSSEQQSMIIDRWWKEAAICALDRRPLLPLPRPRRHA